MKISEITESFDQPRHSVEAAVFTPNSIRMNKAIQVAIKKYKSGEFSPSETLQKLEILNQEIENLLYSDYFDYLAATIPRHHTQLQQDWIYLESTIDQYISQIKNKHSLREDLVDFKAANGQLSAMGSKRSKTKKDSAKNKVEQLFKENKK